MLIIAASHLIIVRVDGSYSSWSKAPEDVERGVQHSEKFSLD